ncbi:MAG: phage shock protein operon transcriptional activator, partial [Frankiales bacterium]|nr:phage shock protein operon transcriptional activator [Frankiales bacterium]
RVVAGVVGEAAALQLLTFLEELDLPDPEQVLADPEAFVLPDRGDRAYAALAAVVAAVLSDLTPARWQAGVRVVAQAAVQGKADVGAVAMQALVQHRPEATALPKEIRAFVPVLTRAGLLAVS